MKLGQIAIALALVASESYAAGRPPASEPCVPIDSAGYVIDKPGRYCVTKDIHTRLDFADHSAEPAVIEIESSDVILDLQGHRLGRGKFFVQPGGGGIRIRHATTINGSRVVEDRRMENITIENGRLTDFKIGIYFYRSHPHTPKPALKRALVKIGPASYKYETTDILIRNIAFERCEEDFAFFDWASSRENFEQDATQNKH
jgi:hypothetical protein